MVTVGKSCSVWIALTGAAADALDGSIFRWTATTVLSVEPVSFVVVGVDSAGE